MFRAEYFFSIEKKTVNIVHHLHIYLPVTDKRHVVFKYQAYIAQHSFYFSFVREKYGFCLKVSSIRLVLLSGKDCLAHCINQVNQ